ncbi:Uncharacterised protein [Legionella beliardensis]|uniref:Uncharacterized protein n=1 Tax=Legionella beliardensis TaxID=91822 RepID=A0A378I4K0_9GAMM|nr:hypothetical protein [Legionella beliardensis]STX30137.1 Uncharacterised protein [Legionella beliardensis]
MKKLLSMLGATLAVIPLLTYADLQPPTTTPTQNDTLTKPITPKAGIKSPEADEKSQKEDESVTGEAASNDDAPVNPIIPPTNNLNDSPGP